MLNERCGEVLSKYVYLVYADNGEEDGYDYYDWLDSAHLTEESARKHILETGIPRGKDAVFPDSDKFVGKTITRYSAPNGISTYADERRRGCNATIRIERGEEES